MDIVKQLSSELGLKTFQVESTLALIEEGATVPFISRYRKEQTGNLDETQIRDIVHKRKYYTELDERRETVLKTVLSKGKLTPQLERKINQAMSKTELEDLYIPFKPKKETRASKARQAGLEPLAEWLLNLKERAADVVDKASEYLCPEKHIDTPQVALQGACDIIAENISQEAELRKWLRQLMMDEGLVTSKVRKKYADQKTKFQTYYDFKIN